MSPAPWPRRSAESPSARATLTAQVLGVLALATAMGTLLPGATAAEGVIGGLLAGSAVVVEHGARMAWRRVSARRPHWAWSGPDVLAGELVHCGVALLSLLLVVGPLSLGPGLVPVWVLAALCAGVATSLPVGVSVRLLDMDPVGSAPAPRRLWARAWGIAAVAGGTGALLVALVGWVAPSRSVSWVAVALLGLAGVALVRSRGTGRGTRPAPP